VILSCFGSARSFVERRGEGDLHFTQQRDSNHSPGPISETRPAGGHGSVHGGMGDGDVLGGYINSTLAQKFNDLTFDDPPLAPHICSKSKSSSVTSHVLNDTGERRSVNLNYPHLCSARLCLVRVQSAALSWCLNATLDSALVGSRVPSWFDLI
jgi:hypothetical protein